MRVPITQFSAPTFYKLNHAKRKTTDNGSSLFTGNHSLNMFHPITTVVGDWSRSYQFTSIQGNVNNITKEQP